jgi:hypothetical protein
METSTKELYSTISPNSGFGSYAKLSGVITVSSDSLVSSKSSRTVYIVKWVAEASHVVPLHFKESFTISNFLVNSFN